MLPEVYQADLLLRSGKKLYYIKLSGGRDHLMGEAFEFSGIVII